MMSNQQWKWANQQEQERLRRESAHLDELAKQGRDPVGAVVALGVVAFIVWMFGSVVISKLDEKPVSGQPAQAAGARALPAFLYSDESK